VKEWAIAGLTLQSNRRADLLGSILREPRFAWRTAESAFFTSQVAAEKQSPRAAKPQAIPGERNAKLVEKRNALLIFKKRNA
jgi:hypothetical protein